LPEAEKVHKLVKFEVFSNFCSKQDENMKSLKSSID